VHGVERWRSNCGCNSGGRPGWHQEWRQPLRETLNWLRDQLTQPFEREMARFTNDAWQTRNHYIDVLLDRSPEHIQQFIKANCKRELSEKEEVHFLRLLELQRHCLLMFTSCGWFFDEISGIETNQILQYALRAMDYAEDIFGTKLHTEFEQRLAKAPSNTYANGAVSYLQNVVPTRVSLKNVAMHFAVASLFDADPFAAKIFNYSVTPAHFHKYEAGQMRLALGKLQIKSEVTHFERSFHFATVYLGQHHIIGNIAMDMTSHTFDLVKKNLTEAFKQSNLGDLISVMQLYFGPEKFTISSLFYDQKREIIASITDKSLTEATKALDDTYQSNYPIMQALEEGSLPLPSAWKPIATQVLQHRLLTFIHTGTDLRTLNQIEFDFHKWQIKPTLDADLLFATNQRILQLMTLLLNEPTIETLHTANALLTTIKNLGLQPDLGRAQNYFFLAVKPYRKGWKSFESSEWEAAYEKLSQLLKVHLMAQIQVATT
jgi:Domain of unknown function (DUF3536)